MYPEPAGILLLEAKTPDILTAAAIAEATTKDPVLTRVMDWVVNGWPASIPDEVSQYSQKKLSLSCTAGCLLYGDRVVVPSALRPAVVELIHATHPGMT